MITVSIFINGNPIFTRSAVNVSKEDTIIQKYDVDDGRKILHARNDGAIPLAIKMLEGIKEK